MKRIFPWIVAGLLLAALGGLFGYRLWLRSYLGGEAFRRLASGAVSSALDVEGEFSAIVPQSLDELYCDLFHGSGGAPLREVLAEQLRAEVRLGWRAKSVERLEIARLRLALAPGGRGIPGGLDGKFPLRRVEVQRLEVAWPEGALEGTKLAAIPEGGQWRLEGEGGALRWGGFMPWQVEKAEGWLRGAGLYLSQVQLRKIPRAQARLEGVFAPGAAADCQATFSGVPVSDFLGADWRARLEGSLSGRLHWKAEAGVPVVEGKVTLQEGMLAALPVLDGIATATRVDAFRRLRITHGSAEVRRAGATLNVTALELESRGLLRVEGAFSITGGEVEGTLQVGVAPSALQWVPGARAKVFTASRGGYLWTPVRLSGPAVQPREDLTARLAAAAVEESVDAVKKGVLDNARGVLDAVSPLVPNGLPFP